MNIAISLPNRYLSIISAHTKTLLQYRINFLFILAGTTIAFASKYFLWKAIYANSASASIAGFDLQEIITYIVITTIIGKLTTTRTEHNITADVRRGNISGHLIRPISYGTTHLLLSVPEFLTNLVLIIIPFTIITLFSLQFTMPGIHNLVLFAISVILSFIINFQISSLIGHMSFVTHSTWGIQLGKQIIFNFFSGALIPLTFFPNIIGTLADILPFKHIIYSPAMLFMGKYANTLEAIKIMAFQCAWIVILAIVLKISWSHAIRRLDIMGG